MPYHISYAVVLLVKTPKILIDLDFERDNVFRGDAVVISNLKRRSSYASELVTDSKSQSGKYLDEGCSILPQLIFV